MKVLLGVGGSPDSLVALPQVVERAAAVGDDLTVAVLDNPASDLPPGDLESQVRRELDRVGVEATVTRIEGDPASGLVDLAETEGFDLVALGGGEQTPMGKISLGGIAEFVIMNARVSVLLVR